MSSSATSSLHNKRLPSEAADHGQRVSDVDAPQQLKLKERQRFFEEVFQHDVDLYLSSAHLTVRDYRRPPIGSVSSMEVNVDMLEQMELLDISDQEALDVFLSSSGDEGEPGDNNNNNDEEEEEVVISNGLFRHVLEVFDAKSRVSSTSSASSSNSQNGNEEDGVETPVFLSDDEEQELTSPPGKAKQQKTRPAIVVVVDNPCSARSSSPGQ